jgi:hypothetical protein
VSETHSDIPSVVERTRPVKVDGAVVSACFVGEGAAFVLGEETLVLARKGEERRIALHGGAILSAVGDTDRIVTGGDDGKVMATDASGATTVIATDAKRRWIDCVAIGPAGSTAWSAGKTAFVRTGKGAEHALDVSSTVGALAFLPKGFRLAIAHYGGATLWFPSAKAEPERLEWKGSHLAAGCRSRRCTAGVWSIARTCACRAIRRACARSIGAPTASGWRPRARPR